MHPLLPARAFPLILARAFPQVRREQLHEYLVQLVANDQWILAEYDTGRVSDTPGGRARRTPTPLSHFALLPLCRYAAVRQFLQIPVALWRARGLHEQSLGSPSLSARQGSVNAGSSLSSSSLLAPAARQGSVNLGAANGNPSASVRTSVMVSAHL